MEPIPNHLTYGASRDGKIYCLRTLREIPQHVTIDGYKRVNLTNKDGTALYSVARLIAITYIANPDNKPEVDHIDRNRSNNTVENLRWATDEEQALNKVGWGKIPHKFIYFEACSNKSYYSIQIRNSKIKYKKRYDALLFNLQDVLIERNKILTQYEIPIID